MGYAFFGVPFHKVMGFRTCSFYIFKKQINKNREGTWNTNRKKLITQHTKAGNKELTQ